MTTRLINDPESLERQRKLLAAFELQADVWSEKAEAARAAGDLRAVVHHERLAQIDQQAADRIRLRLVALSGLTEGDVAVSGGQLPSGGLCDLMQRGPGDTAWLPAQTVAPPVDYQAYATPVLPDDVNRVTRWLRDDLPHWWQGHTWTQLQTVARWLLMLRAACWAGRWRV